MEVPAGGLQVAAADRDETQLVEPPAPPELVARLLVVIDAGLERLDGLGEVPVDEVGVASSPGDVAQASDVAQSTVDLLRLVQHGDGLGQAGAALRAGEVDRQGQVVEGVGDLAWIAHLPLQLQGPPVRGEALLDAALPPQHPAERLGRLGPPRQRPSRHGERRVQTAPGLEEVAPGLPEAPHRRGQPQRPLRVACLHRPIVGCSDVVVVGGDPVEIELAVVAEDVGGHLLGQRRVHLQVPGLDGLGFSRLDQALGGVLPDHLQHPDARSALALNREDQALVEEDAQSLEHVRRPVAAAHLLDLLDTSAAGEHGETPEERPMRLVEQVVAPVDGAGDGALPFGEVDRTGGQDPVAEPLHDGADRQQAHLWGDQLDGERQPVQPPNQLGDRRRVLLGQLEVGPDRHRPLHEQPRRIDVEERFHAAVGHPERAHRHLLLAADVEWAPRGDHELGSGRDPGQFRHHRGGADDLLEVVEDEEHLLVSEMLEQGVGGRPGADRSLQPEGYQHLGGDDVDVAHR